MAAALVDLVPASKTIAAETAKVAAMPARTAVDPATACARAKAALERGASGPVCNASRSRANTCAERSHFCVIEGWARTGVLVAARAAGMPAHGVHPQMRILHYPRPGGIMAPHVDLSKAVEPEEAQ